MHKHQLSIVLPCYNPPQDWEEHVSMAYQKIEAALGFAPELIIVNDGSSKDIEKDIALLKSKVPYLTYHTLSINKGKGAALRKGVSLASADIIIYTDIDFPYTVDSFMQVYTALAIEQNDVAVGIKDKTYYQHLPKYRIFISKTLRKGIGFFFNMPITDTQCGLKGFNQKGKTIFLNTTIDRYLFDLEFVYQSFRKHLQLKVKPIEVKLRPNVVFRAMNLKVLASESANFLKILFKKSAK